MIGLGLGLGIAKGASPGTVGGSQLSAPTNISGTDTGGGNIQITWTDAGFAPYGYRWEVWVDGGSMFNFGTTPFGSQPINTGGLSTGNYFARMLTLGDNLTLLDSSSNDSGVFAVA